MAKAQTPGDLQPPSKAQTFEFAKRTFVSGLFWQPLPGATARIRKAEVEKMGDEQDFDLVVLRTSGVPQAGFASLADGVQPHMLSVAAMVSKSLEIANRERSFLCALEVPGGQWLYVAQREGVLLHDGDFLGTEEAVRSRMLTDISLIEWQTIFAPKHWDIAIGVDKTFEELMPKQGGNYSFKSWWELRLIKGDLLQRIKDQWPIVALIFAVTVGYNGYVYWQQWQVEKNMGELAQQEATVAAEKAAVYVDHPWKKLARATNFMAACDTTIEQVKTFWPGSWVPKDAICAPEALTVVWTRQDHGLLDHLLEIEPKAVPTLDGNSASLTLPIAIKTGDNEALPKEKVRVLEMVGASQRYGFNLVLASHAAEPMLPGQAPSVQAWKTLNWSVSNVHLPPSVIIPALDGECFRVKQIKLAFTGGVITWTMEGTQYVQP